MFERFTVAAREVVVRAQQEARDLKHPEIGTEHLLLAMLSERAGTAYQVLSGAGLEHARVVADVRRLSGAGAGRLSDDDAAALQTVGIDLDAVLAKIEESFGPDALQEPAPRRRRGLLGLLGDHKPFTPRAKKVLELSLREALQLHDKSLGTEHILLGLLRDPAGVALKVLQDAGLTPDGLRRSTLEAMGRSG